MRAKNVTWASVVDRGGGNPAMDPIRFGYKLWPPQGRNKCEILGNILSIKLYYKNNNYNIRWPSADCKSMWIVELRSKLSKFVWSFYYENSLWTQKMSSASGDFSPPIRGVASEPQWKLHLHTPIRPTWFGPLYSTRFGSASVEPQDYSYTLAYS